MALFRRSSSEKSARWGALFFIIITVASFIMGIRGFTGQNVTLDDAFANGISGGEIVSGTPVYGGNQYALKVKHTVRSIPVGNDYYYYILSEDEESILAVRAPKDFGKNFDGEYKNTKNVRIKGKVKRMDYKVRNSLSSGYGDDYYIDLLSSRMSILWLTVGILNLIIIGLFVFLNIKKNNDSYFSETAVYKALGAFMLCAFIAAGVLLIYVMSHI